MARPQKNKVDYFPHPVTHSKKMSYMEKKYKNDGYAVWFKILEELGNTDYHYLNLSDEVQVMFLSDRCLVSEETLLNIISDLVKLREFDKMLWDENRILFNEKFVDSISDAYAKRSNLCIDKKSLLHHLTSLGIRKQDKSSNKQSKCNSEGGENTQTKLKETKEDKIKEDKIGLVFPFDSKEFKNQWELWKDYKVNEFKFKYKTIQSEQAALSQLANMADGNEQKAIKIIHQSFANGWKGFFEIKEQKSQTKRNAGVIANKKMNGLS